jgi:hypothetical protein
MNLENILTLGDPMVPKTRKEIISYDKCPLVGTFQIGKDTILFWTSDAPDEPQMRYVYSLLTQTEARQVEAYFSRTKGGDEAYKAHPLLAHRCIIVGKSDKDWNLAETVIIERSTTDVFAEVDRLFPL